MSLAVVVANIDRAGDHAAVLGVMVLVAAVGGLVYGLARIVARSRARSARRPKTDRTPDA